jgi:HAD superfamily hydrolase (TIGR01490 family)
MKRIAALFDCDGTLYTAQYGRGLMKYSSAHGRALSARLYLASMLPLFALRKLRLIPEEKFHNPLLTRMGWMIKGMDEGDFLKFSEWVLHQHLLPTERPEVIARMRDHQAKGHAVVLVSAQFYPSLAMLASHYKTEGLVGTKLELKDGRYTGNIIPPVISGDAKDHYTREYFSSNNIDIDWGSSYAYADSITDMGLFGLVGNPVAVHPDKKLYETAKSKKWEIIGTPKE